MLKSSHWIGLSLVFILALPVFGADEKKANKKKDQDADPKEAKPEKLVYSTTFKAKLTVVSSTSQKELTVQIQYSELNQQAYASYLRQQQQLAVQQQRLMLIRNPIQRQQALAQLVGQAQRPPGNLYQVKTKDIELRTTDDLKVRSLEPPVDYDDKGHVKKYTKKELATLKGPDKTLPGYTADFDALRPNQYVKVYLAKPKADAKKAKKKVKKKDKKEKKEDADDDDSLEDESKPAAVMIVITAEAKMKE